MEEKEKLELYRNAIKIYGIRPQVQMVYEECGELIAALAKLFRQRVDKSDVITELADVSIMVEQMAILFGYDEYIKEKEYKLSRLKDRLEKHGNKDGSNSDSRDELEKST